MLFSNAKTSRHVSPGVAGGAATWRSRPVLVIILLGVVVTATIAVGTGTLLLHLRDRALAESEIYLRNLALVLAEQTNRSFQAVELVQKSAIDRMRALGITSGADYERRMSDHDTHLMLKDIISGVPQIDAVTMVGSQGKLINSSRSSPIPDVDVSDRDYFQALKTDAQLTSFISEPVRDRGTGKWTVSIARRFSGPNGEFLGLVLGTMELRYFEEFYRKVTLGTDGSVSLVRRDGILLARYPHVEASIGQSFAQSPLFSSLISKINSGAMRLTSPVDGQDRLVIAHELPNYPIVVCVGTIVAAALADWRSGAWYLVGSAVLIAIVVGCVVFLAGRQVGKTLHVKNVQLESALNNMVQGLCMYDAQQRLVICNGRYAQMYGLAPAEVRPGTTLRQIIERRIAAGIFAGPDPSEYMRQVVENRILEEITTGLDSAKHASPPGALVTPTSRHTRALSDGRVIEVVNHPIDGGGWVATHVDVTERRRAEKERDRSNALLDLVIQNIPVTIAVKDARDLRYVLINRAGEKYYGMPRDQMIGKTAREVLPMGSADLVTKLDQQLLTCREAIHHEHMIEMPGHVTRIGMSTRLPIADENGKLRYVLVVVDDITERKQAEQRIKHMAQHDMLTGLPNRVLLCEELDRALARVQRGERIAVLYLDLDHFKRVNDTLGHLVGDELLRQAADRLRECVGETVMIARLGGDEFAVLQTALEQPSDAAALAAKIDKALSKPFDLNGHRALVGVSIGISIAPNDATERDQLLKNADLALYGAKDSGRGTYHFYEPELDKRMKARQKLEFDLRNALADGQFELHYQPVVNLQTNDVVGCEALLRWHHPERGLVSPAEFIPVAEESGIITSIGEWVLRQACADAAAWPEDVHVAVNLSPAQLKAGTVVQLVVNALASSGLSAHRLELEITETVLMQNTFATLATLHQLRKLGVRISLDDFGTGYSSLSYLRSFPFDKIKIDRSFIENISDEDDCVVIVQAVTTMAQRLRMTTTAEGVETEEQRHKLQQLGCTEMQGYLFSRPQPVGDIVRSFLSRPEEAASAA